ncbi:MAG TPA: phosphate acyltransferase PlsX [Woeseiaceae bacterium]|nr:phosphate acyltransferase PlsX [Woeseiaceae bacterium]
MNSSMQSQYTISLDAMSGDLGPDIVVEAAKRSLDRHPNLHIIFVGRRDEINDLVIRVVGENSRVSIHDAIEVIKMSDSPVDAVRNKKKSSMRIAIDNVKSKEADACVSAGNTGALMAIAKFVLKMLPGIDRPAIIGELPAKGRTVHMLDLGANIMNDPDQLFQFALMGSIVAGDICDIQNPKVALLNIGSEDLKGNDNVKAAANLLSASGLNYIGFIEGNEIFSGKTDVVVTDGFTGNVALKAMEGTADFVIESLRLSFQKNFFTKMQALISKPVLTDLTQVMDARKYNGASLVGLDGIVIKSHGSADAYSFHCAIETALIEVKNQVPNQIRNLLKRESS